jgi:hypothetical protein
VANLTLSQAIAKLPGATVNHLLCTALLWYSRALLIFAPVAALGILDFSFLILD